jgi:hypothetical protein
VRGDDWLVRDVQDLRREVRELRAANPFAPMGIKPKQGGTVFEGFVTTEDVFTVRDDTGEEVARFGPLDNTNPGRYGIELKYNGSWVQVGAGNVDWGNIANKPSVFPPGGHTHAGTDVTSRVGAATDAIGSASGWANNVQGTTFYAAWIGNDGSFSFGRNTSSIRYKQNVRDHTVDPGAVLRLQPRLYDRKDYTDHETGETRPGARDEYGLIAEEVDPHLPEIVTRFEGQIDGIRYDLLAVALLEVVKDQQARIEALEAKLP